MYNNTTTQSFNHTERYAHLVSVILTILFAITIPLLFFVLAKSIWLASNDLPITWYMIFCF